MNEDRESYLESSWRPYPAAPRAEQRKGKSCHRIAQIDGGEIVLDSGQMVLGLNWLGRLGVGDWVQVGPNGIEELLAPSRVERPQAWLSSSEQMRWSQFLRAVREVFWERGFDEVTTPSLVVSPGVEEYLHGFYTWFQQGSTQCQLALPTSPEFALKKMLSSGCEKIFEIKTCFRNEEQGAHHQPEFQMIEWYRSFAGLQDIAVDLESLLEELAGRLSIEVGRVQHISVQEAFFETVKAKISPDVSTEELLDIAKANEIQTEAQDSWNDVFFRIVLEKIEPFLEKMGPVVLHSYPKPQAALSRLNEEGWAERFEFYWRGLEIANAFDELNDPFEQRQRFQDCNKKRCELGFDEMPIDQEFLAALEHGLPPSSGIALGLERLYMAFYGIKDIRKVRSFTL